MAEPLPSYFIDTSGKTVEIPTEQADQASLLGYVPAGKEQIQDFQKEQAFHAKYGTTGQQLKTFGEGAAQALTFGLSDYAERGLGVNPEDIKAREEENPGSHMAGTIAGVAAPLIATAGGSALAEGAAGAAEAAEGGAGLVRGAAEFTAPRLISGAGEAASEGVSHLLGGLDSSATARIISRGASAGVGSAIEGAAYGLGQVVHESALGDPNLTASSALEEVGLSSLLGGGIGAGTGIMSKLIGETAAGPLGKKLESWADTFEGNQNIKTAAGAGKGQAALRGLYKKMSPAQASKLGEEAGELGLIGKLDGPSAVYEKSGAMMDDVGPKLDEGIRAVDAAPGAAHPTAGEVAARLRENVLKPLDVVGGDKALVANIEGEIDGLVKDVGGPDAKLSFEQMNDIRRNINKRVYGYNGNLTISNAQKAALHDLASGFGDEIAKGIDASGGDFAPIKALNRQYSVAATMKQIAEKGMAGAGLSGVPLTALISGAAGLVSGGPLGAAALGAGAMLAKRYGPQLLASGARTVRTLVDEGAAGELASKTGEAIAAARQAGVDAAESTRPAALWNKVTGKLAQPIGAPAQDLARDLAKDSVAKRMEGTPVETVAALSQLERANNRVANRIGGQVAAIVHATPKIARTEAVAGVASAFAKPNEDAAKAFAKRAEKIRQMAATPSLMQEKLTGAVSDLAEHAPQTAQAIQIAMARCVAVLNASLPPVSQRAPLQKPEPPSPDQVAKFNRCYEVVENPSAILKQAAAGTLTPEAIQAVQAAHPAQFQAMQAAIIQKLSTHKAPIPYTQRQMLSLVMGRDMDGTTTPAMLQASQAAHAPQPAPSNAGSVKPTSKGESKLTLSSRLLTPAQASASRR